MWAPGSPLRSQAKRWEQIKTEHGYIVAFCSGARIHSQVIQKHTVQQITRYFQKQGVRGTCSLSKATTHILDLEDSSDTANLSVIMTVQLRSV